MAKAPARHLNRAPASQRQPIDRDFILRKDARFAEAPPAKKNRADSTEYQLGRVAISWIKYCRIMHGEAASPDQLLKDAKLDDFRRYFHFRLGAGTITTQSSVWTEWKLMLCNYQDVTGQEVEAQTRREMHGLLYGQFVDEYDLKMTPGSKPVMSVEDLLVVLHHLWAFDVSTFPVERQRVQLSLLLLVTAYTSSRPGALVEASCALGSNQCVTYNDVRLLIIPNPEEPERNVVLMEITLLYTKGNRQTKKPTTYLFHEREDNLALCPILHFLSLALADDAFKADGLRSAEDVYGLEVTGGRNSLELKWKECMRDVPVFRRSVRAQDGIITSPHLALTYDTFKTYLKKLGIAAGFRMPLTPYCLRRAAANELDGRATDAERNQVLGHTRSEIFLRHYLREQVKVDVESAYLGVPSRHALIRAVGLMSLNRDVRVPQSLSDEQKLEVRQQPDLVSLAARKSASRESLIRDFGLVKNAGGTPGHSEHLRLQRDYDAMEKTALEGKLAEIREAFFGSIDTREVEAQLRSKVDGSSCADRGLFTPVMPSHVFQERSRLATDLFGEVKSEKEQADAACRARRCGAIRDMADLTFKRETPRQETAGSKSDVSEALLSDIEKLTVFADEPDLFPIACPGTVCLFCLGNEALTSLSRTFSFARKDSLSRHVEKTHLRYINPSDTFQCPHPACTASCQGHDGFKSHAERVHNVSHAC